MVGVQNLILYGNGRVLCAFHRTPRASITMKLFFYLIMREKVIAYFELQLSLLNKTVYIHRFDISQL